MGCLIGTVLENQRYSVKDMQHVATAQLQHLYGMWTWLLGSRYFFARPKSMIDTCQMYDGRQFNTPVNNMP